MSKEGMLGDKLRMSPNLRDALEEDDSVHGEWSEEWLAGKVFVQKDGGGHFEVVSFTDGRDVRLVRLRPVGGGIGVITLGLAEFIEKLKTEGSPWSLLEEGR